MEMGDIMFGNVIIVIVGYDAFLITIVTRF